MARKRMDIVAKEEMDAAVAGLDVDAGASGNPNEAFGQMNGVTPMPLVDASPHLGSVVDAHAPAPAEEHKPKRWTVSAVRLTRSGDIVPVSHGGQKVRMHPGKLIDERYFDVRVLREQGVELKEVSE